MLFVRFPYSHIRQMCSFHDLAGYLLTKTCLNALQYQDKDRVKRLQSLFHVPFAFVEQNVTLTIVTNSIATLNPNLTITMSKPFVTPLKPCSNILNQCWNLPHFPSRWLPCHSLFNFFFLNYRLAIQCEEDKKTKSGGGSKGWSCWPVPRINRR